MKLKVGIVVAGIVLGSSALAKTTLDDGVIDSVYSLESLLVESRFQYLPVSPPTSDPYVDIRENMLPVDWKAFKNKAFTSQMYAEMSPDGFPIYRVGVRLDFWTGETVFHNSYGTEVLRLAPAEQEYDPYIWAKDYFQVSSSEELSDTQRLLYPSSKIELEVYLLPEIFFPTYQEIEAEQVTLELAMQEVSASVVESNSVTVGMSLVPAEAVSSVEDEPIAMALAPPPPDGGGDTNNVSGGGSSNLVVELSINLPEDFGNYLEIFQKDDLIYDQSWEISSGASWLPTHGADTVQYTDPTSTNQSTRFYMVSDAGSGADTDGDGYSDLREAYISLTVSNSFNLVDTDADGLHDWWELKLFGDLSQTGTSDFDGDGLLNGEELVFASVAQPPVMITDPSLYSSDGDVLGDAEMFTSPPTDAWNPDADKPSASILYPTNNTVVAF